MPTNAQPGWWREEHHVSAWERVKEAIQRDWEQTKRELHIGRHARAAPSGAPRDLAGTRGVKTGANTFEDTPWEDVEGPMAFGYAAHERYGAVHGAWDDALEERLRHDWETSGTLGERKRRRWKDVKRWVRMGFDRAQPTH